MNRLERIVAMILSADLFLQGLSPNSADWR